MLDKDLYDSWKSRMEVYMQNREHGRMIIESVETSCQGSMGESLTTNASIWKAFGGNTRDLGSFGEETDKTTDLHQHLSRISTQKLETASQITRDTVTTHLKTA
ncbi:hypothetical protein Tco_1269875, partial [Tanacetum coccineum]